MLTPAYVWVPGVQAAVNNGNVDDVLRQIRFIQASCLGHAAGIVEANRENWGAAYNDLGSEIGILNEEGLQNPGRVSA